MTDWQPIATAPKDGTLIRVRFADGKECDARNFGDGDDYDDQHNGWWSHDGLDFNYGHDTPTHWRPNAKEN